MRNNVIYTWKGNGTYGAEAMHVNNVNNYYKSGPATDERTQNRIITVNAKTEERPFPTIQGGVCENIISLEM